MSTFPLDQIDEHLLKQIVRKFTAISGAAFYGSCRGAKNLVDRVKPVWSFPESNESSRLYYSNTTRAYGWGSAALAAEICLAEIPLEFSRIAEVEVHECATSYFKAVVLPQIAAIASVGMLIIEEIPEDDVQLLIAAAKPKTVAMWDEDHDPTSAIFENIKNLHIRVHRNNLESYWRTKKLFELARNRRSITLHLYDSSREIIASFSENWLKGEKTGTLEQLTVILPSAYRTVEAMCTIRKETENLMKSHIKTEEGYIVERRGLDRLRICTDFDTAKIVFHFS